MTSDQPSGHGVNLSFVAKASIPSEVRKRMSPYLFFTTQPRLIPELEAAGWVLDKRLRRSVRMRSQKSHDNAFEDRVWSAFAKLSFDQLNRGSGVVVFCGPTPGDSYRASVFAADDEVVLVVHCVSADTLRTHSLRREIDQIEGQRADVIKALKRDFPKHKIKFVIATNNLRITQSTMERLSSSDIVHMDEDVVEYYIELADHLGRAARYQLLGNLFAGQKIPNLDVEVVAIEAKMGGHKYYSFSIEPERLLKLAYILHRNKANTNLMPTYQRLIKKSRLKGVADFVESGGYFPNSLILSLDTKRRGAQFDPFQKHIGETRAGILRLPQTFRAAYVIDGQHRLYGYADSARAEVDLIPVVAFTDLERSDQVRLFMQINENQQAVPKNLRNTLNADLLSGSSDLREQIKALKLQVAQYLGESKSSPLYGRVIIGENRRTAIQCITIDAMSRGLERSNLLGSFTKSAVKEKGSFYFGSNDATLKPLSNFLSACFERVKMELDSQYRLGSAEGGFVFINIGVESLIRIFGDIVDHLVDRHGVVVSEESADEVAELCMPYVAATCAALRALDSTQAKEYRTFYGSGGSTKYWRRLQIAVKEVFPDFTPSGLSDYLTSEERQFNKESFEMISSLERFLKQDVRQRLQDEFAADWFKRGVPRKIQVEAGKLAVERNADSESGDELEPWDCLYLINYQDILLASNELWLRVFQKRYTRPGDESLTGSWKKRVDWIGKLNALRNDVSHNRSISVEDYEFLVTLVTWLIDGRSDNDL